MHNVGVSSSFLDEFGHEDGKVATADPDGEKNSGKRGSGRRRPTLSVRPLTALGIGLLVIGMACLGWVAFQYFGTNLVSERAFETTSQQLRQKWSEEKKSDPGKKMRASEVEGEAIALLRIPAFGEKYEIPILNGTDLSILAKGVGHYSSTAQPGQIGNFAIAGHRVTHGQPFARLLELEKGDQIIVETRDAIYTYVLDDSPSRLTVSETDTWVIDPVPGQPDAKPTRELITLTTCQDLFRSPDRSIGFGHLETTQNK
jgi:sortase A